MGSGEDTPGGTGGGVGGIVRGALLKALVVFGGVILIRRLRRSTTRWDHARAVADALSGEKFSREQARQDPGNYFNLRMLTCPATEMVDGSGVLYFEQAFWRAPEKPFRQRFYMVKPCPKEMKCDVEVEQSKLLPERMDNAIAESNCTMIGMSEYFICSPMQIIIACISASRDSLQWNNYRYTANITESSCFRNTILAVAGMSASTNTPSTEGATMFASSAAAELLLCRIIQYYTPLYNKCKEAV
ncbi:hypothetical protein ACQJBY_032613 [Aegilops geniculata]